jgi:nucleotide-binding universal stress UspA family protein
MPNTIIIGSDGSAQAEGALRFGAALARARGARVVVTAAYQHMPPLRGDGGAFEQFERSDAEDIARRGARSLEGVVEVRPLVAAGTTLGAALHRAAEAEGADLIVIATSARRRIGGLQPGSVAEQVVHNSPCPVAVVPPFEGEPRFARIGVALDHGAPARAALDFALTLAPSAGDMPELRLMHVSRADHVPQPGTTPTAPDRARAREFLDDTAAEIAHRGQVELREQAGDPAKELVRMSEGLDLLVCGSRDHGAVKRLLLGSVSTHLVRNATCPVVVVPAHAGTTGGDAIARADKATA